MCTNHHYTIECQKLYRASLEEMRRAAQQQQQQPQGGGSKMAPASNLVKNAQPIGVSSPPFTV